MPTTQTVRFGPIDVDYDARVLVPRAWTLIQSAWAAELCVGGAARDRILELCAGVGHIGLAAAVLADRNVVQVECEPVAVEYAAANARRAGWADRAEIRGAELRDALRPGESFAVILADPPYLSTTAVARWPHDPPAAIDGGSDGLDLIRVCLQLAAEHLADRGSLLLQIAGPDQADEVAQLVAASPHWRLLATDVRVIDPERAVMRIDRQRLESRDDR